MAFVADLHIHSKYSRATSKDMDVAHIAEGAKIKGIGLMGTGDFTHHLWLEELKSKLEPTDEGLFVHEGVHFILSAEVSSIYGKNGRTYRIHNVILAPSFKSVDAINRALGGLGNLASDGRPILGLDAEELAKIVFDIDENCMVIPAHCLVPGTHVHTEKGIKAIEDISTRDRVYTHAGRFRKVTRALQRDYKGDILHIKPYYFSQGVRVTPEHPFYAIRTQKDCLSRGSFCAPGCAHLRQKGCARKFFGRYRPQWVQAKDLRLFDVLVFPRFNEKVVDKKKLQIHKFIAGNLIRRKEKVAHKGTRPVFVNNDIDVNGDFCRLAGYFVSEGYTNGRDAVMFCFSDSEKKYVSDVVRLMKKVFDVDLSHRRLRKDHKGVELIFYSKVLCHVFSGLFYADIRIKKAHTKSLPPWMLDLSFDKQAQVIKGWWRGDKGYTTSKILMNQMKILFLRLGILPSIGLDAVASHKKRGKHFLGLRQIKANHDIFYFNNLSFFKDTFRLLRDNEFKRFRTKRSTRHGWLDGCYAYLPIRAILKSAFKGKVYNLEVQTDNSYVCEFAAVHNCWTPWFSLFGSNSGFDRIEDCFGKQTSKIFALETGLSSDPAMNWRLSALDRFSLVSNSDSHSPMKIGREANVFECPMSYFAVRDALRTKDKKKFLYTIEFFPQEGKYHFDGHRACGVRFSPQESVQHKGRCPKCGKPLTIGVMNRIHQLADREEGFVPENAIPYKNLIPLDEIIADAKGVGKGSVAVEKEFRQMIARFGTEFAILTQVPQEDLGRLANPKVAEGIARVRAGRVTVEPGFDGEYGKVAVFGADEAAAGDQQMSLF